MNRTLLWFLGNLIMSKIKIDFLYFNDLGTLLEDIGKYANIKILRNRFPRACPGLLLLQLQMELTWILLPLMLNILFNYILINAYTTYEVSCRPPKKNSSNILLRKIEPFGWFTFTLLSSLFVRLFASPNFDPLVMTLLSWHGVQPLEPAKDYLKDLTF